MKDKVYIAISFLIVVLVVEMVGVTYKTVGKEKQVQEQTSVLGKSVDTNLVSKLCEDYNLGSNQLTDTSEKPSAVKQCGKFYRVDPPSEKTASPFKMITKNGDVAALCGGGSFSSELSSSEQPECELSCSLENLCGK
jgi:hypothetical protein